MGTADLAMTSGGTLEVVLGRGDGTFGAATGYPAGSNGYELVAADLDGDGNQDIVVADQDNGSAAVQVLLGKGDGTLKQAVSYASLACAYGVAATDFDGDGKIDVAMTGFGASCLGSGDGGVAILRGGVMAL